jgi:hypothetical protein
MRELTTSEAVRECKIHPNVLIRAILMERVQAHKDVNGHWLIDRSSLETWDRNRVRRKAKDRQYRTASESVSNEQNRRVSEHVFQT